MCSTSIICWCCWCCARVQVAPNYPIVRNNLAVALTDLGTTLKVRGQLRAGRGVDLIRRLRSQLQSGELRVVLSNCSECRTLMSCRPYGEPVATAVWLLLFCLCQQKNAFRS